MQHAARGSLADTGSWAQDATGRVQLALLEEVPPRCGAVPSCALSSATGRLPRLRGHRRGVVGRRRWSVASPQGTQAGRSGQCAAGRLSRLRGHRRGVAGGGRATLVGCLASRDNAVHEARAREPCARPSDIQAAGECPADLAATSRRAGPIRLRVSERARPGQGAPPGGGGPDAPGWDGPHVSRLGVPRAGRWFPRWGACPGRDAGRAHATTRGRGRRSGPSGGPRVASHRLLPGPRVPSRPSRPGRSAHLSVAPRDTVEPHRRRAVARPVAA